MKRILGCLRKIQLFFRCKRYNKKWAVFIENHCAGNSKLQWCQLIMENFEEISKYNNPNEETLKELRSTNISSEIIKVLRNDYALSQTPFTLLIEIYSTYANHKYTDVVNPSQVTISKINSDTEGFVDFMRSL
jgi:hypothetical protein